MRYLEPTFTQRLLGRQAEIDRSLRHFVGEREARLREEKLAPQFPSFVERSIGIAKLWHLREQLPLAAGIQSEDAYAWVRLEQIAQDLLSEDLVQARTVTRSWGGTLYFVYLPSWNRYAHGPRGPERDRTNPESRACARDTGDRC